MALGMNLLKEKSDQMIFQKEEVKREGFYCALKNNYKGKYDSVEENVNNALEKKEVDKSKDHEEHGTEKEEKRSNSESRLE